MHHLVNIVTVMCDLFLINIAVIILKSILSWRFPTVLPYNSEWPNIFQNEKISLAQILNDELISIHNIGSTAITILKNVIQLNFISYYFPF
ncbi:GrpB family protein [Macrococcoides caseolyticum]|uniref:GrpB family protein n=1 Tax=Macrococcoides caseolyticum TaxID=69966 RepID=UPI00339D923A